MNSVGLMVDYWGDMTISRRLEGIAIRRFDDVLRLRGNRTSEQ